MSTVLQIWVVAMLTLLLLFTGCGGTNETQRQVPIKRIPARYI